MGQIVFKALVWKAADIFLSSDIWNLESRKKIVETEFHYFFFSSSNIRFKVKKSVNQKNKKEFALPFY